METWLPNPEQTQAFITRWQEGGGSERANYQLYQSRRKNHPHQRRRTPRASTSQNTKLHKLMVTNKSRTCRPVTLRAVAGSTSAAHSRIVPVAE